MLDIVSTADVALADLELFADHVGSQFEVSVSKSQIHLRSVDPPSWATLLAEAPWWIQGLGAAAALYVAELVKEAAKETWRERAKVLGTVKTAGNRLGKLAEGLVDLRNRLSAPTTLGIGLPVPSEFFPTHLAIEGNGLEEVTAQLALFVHHLPALSRLLSEQGAAERAATGVHLELQDDGALSVWWHDRETLAVNRHLLDPHDSV